jgi:hypothetical protein
MNFSPSMLASNDHRVVFGIKKCVVEDYEFRYFPLWLQALACNATAESIPGDSSGL